MKMKVIAIIGGTQKNQAIKKDGIVPCLTSSMGCGGGYVPMIVYETKTDNADLRIRKRTEPPGGENI